MADRTSYYTKATLPPGVMTVEEIRYWLLALPAKHGWEKLALSRTLGIKDRTSGSIRGKARGTQWIYRTEQKRFSQVLKRIIAGELVCVPWQRAVRGYAVIADHPVPLPQPVQYQFSFKRGLVSKVLPRHERVSRVPSFRTAMKNAGRWRECTFPEDERRERDP